MKNIVKKHWPIIFISFLSVIPIIAFSLNFGTDLYVDFSLELHIDPLRTTINMLHIWNPDQLGINIGFGASYTPINIFYLLLSLVIKMWIIQRIFTSLIILISGLSIYKLQKILRISKEYRIIGSLFYMYNFVLLLFIDSSSIKSLSYSLAPLILYFTIIGLHKKDFKYAILISISTIPFAGINPPMTVIAFSPSILYLIYNLLWENGKPTFNIEFITIITIISFLLNIYWLVSTYETFFSSYSIGTFASIFVFENLNLTNRYSSYLEVFRLLGAWGFYEGWKGKWYYSYAPFYIKDPIGIITSYLMPLMAICGLFTNKNKYKLFFGVLIVIFIPLSVGSYPPSHPELLGRVFLWLYENIPLFSSFRDTYKFSMILALSYSILIALFSESLVEILKNNLSKMNKLYRINSQHLKTGMIILIIIIIIVAYWPMWTGKIKSSDIVKFKVPNYYNNLKTYVSGNIGEERIMLTPYRYFSVYEWGESGGEILSALLENPLIYEDPGVVQDTSSDSGYLINILYNDIYSNKTANVPLLMHILGIQYIFQQNDILWQYYNSKNPQEMEQILLNINGVKKVNSFGKVDVYKILQNNPYVESFDKVIYVKNNTGRYIYSEMINKISNKDLGVDIPVYLDENVKGNIISNNLKKPDAIKYNRITPTLIEIAVSNSTMPYIVVFKENYNDWFAEIEGNIIPQKYHFKANGFANGWYIDKKGSYIITIRYKPQQWFYYGIIISTLSLLLCVTLLFRGWWTKEALKDHR